MEDWKAITEFESKRYEISSWGRVRSNYSRTKEYTIIKYSLNQQGKPQVNLVDDNGKRVTRTIESLVCRYHLNYIVPHRNVPVSKRVMYRNGNREDVRVKNLILPVVNQRIA